MSLSFEIQELRRKLNNLILSGSTTSKEQAAALELKQDILNGQGFIKADGNEISYDNTQYEPFIETKNSAYNKNFGTVPGTVSEGHLHPYLLQDDIRILTLGETSATAYRGDRGKTAYDHSQLTHNKAFVGLGNVDNTSDANKPVSTAQLTALNLKVDKVLGRSLVLDTDIAKLAAFTVIAGKVTIDRDTHIAGNLTASADVIAYVAGAVSGTVLDALSVSSPLVKTGTNIALNLNPSHFNAVGGQLNYIGTVGMTSVQWSDIQSKPSFATVATSGSYNDLSNKPSLTSTIAGATDVGTYFTGVKAKVAIVADSANAVTWGNVSGKPATYYTHPATHAPSIIAQDANNRFVSDTEKGTWDGKQSAGDYFKFETFGADANTLAGNRSSFTYAVNALNTGPIAHFYASGYGMQINGDYSNVNGSFAIRTRNGDAGSWNPWRTIYHSGNLTQNLTANYLPVWDGSKLVNSGIESRSNGLYFLSNNNYLTRFLSTANNGSLYYHSILIGKDEQPNQSVQNGWIYDIGTPTNSWYHITPYGQAEGGIFKLFANGDLKLGSTTPSTSPATGALTVGGGLGVGGSLNVGGANAYFGSQKGYTYIWQDQLNFGFSDNSSYSGVINYCGYNQGFTQFRNLDIYNGKGEPIASFIGSNKATSFNGNITAPSITLTTGAGVGRVLTSDGSGNASWASSINISGSIVAGGEVTAFSDRRLKSNIQPLRLRGDLQPVTYIKDSKQSIGFIAQEVRRFYPELVLGDESKEMLSLNYQQLTAVLYAEILNLKKEIRELKPN